MTGIENGNVRETENERPVDGTLSGSVKETGSGNAERKGSPLTAVHVTNCIHCLLMKGNREREAGNMYVCKMSSSQSDRLFKFVFTHCSILELYLQMCEFECNHFFDHLMVFYRYRLSEYENLRYNLTVFRITQVILHSFLFYH